MEFLKYSLVLISAFREKKYHKNDKILRRCIICWNVHVHWNGGNYIFIVKTKSLDIDVFVSIDQKTQSTLFTERSVNICKVPKYTKILYVKSCFSGPWITSVHKLNNGKKVKNTGVTIKLDRCNKIRPILNLLDGHVVS